MFLLIELPNDVATWSILAIVAATVSFATLSTSKLLTVDEMLEALSRGDLVEYLTPFALVRLLMAAKLACQYP